MLQGEDVVLTPLSKSNSTMAQPSIHRCSRVRTVSSTADVSDKDTFLVRVWSLLCVGLFPKILSSSSDGWDATGGMNPTSSSSYSLGE